MKKYSQHKGNILLIDDLSDNLELFSELLLLGYNVRSIKHDRETLKNLKFKQPDVILVNIEQVSIEYKGICETFKNHYQLKQTPIIFIVNYHKSFDKSMAFKVGMSDYIIRPFKLDEVIKKLENQLMIKRQKLLLEEEIKKRKKIEQILGHSRALILSILNNSTDGVAALQSIRNEKTGEIKDFRCLVINPIFAQLFNRNQSDIVGKLGFKNLISEIDIAFFHEFVKVVETGKTFQRDFCYPLKKSCWYQFVAVKLEDGFTLTIRDITIHKNNEIKLQEGNRKLQLMANLDALTQVANRRCFDDFLKAEWEKHLQGKNPLTLIMIDIDYFKLYNDFYGHQKGDDCLARVAQSIAIVIKRPTDLVARYGGEEFAVVLPNTKLEGGVMIAELIEITVASLAIPHEKSKVSDYVTLSMGVGCFTPNNDLTPKDLIKKADNALYKAKNRGRNSIFAVDN